MSTTKTTLDDITDLEAYIGMELGLSPWMQISQERINTFAEVTEDLQWIHTDPKRSEIESPYGATVAHGFLVLSLTPHLIAQTFAVKKRSMGINYGMDKVRFPNATKVGSFIRARVAVMEYDRISKGTKFKLKVTIEIQHEQKPACVAELISLVYG